MTKLLPPHDAEEAAKKLREDWDLGYDPIPDVAATLEDRGNKLRLNGS